MKPALRPLVDRDIDAVVSLWETCGLTRPWNDPRRDIARARAVWPELLLVAVEAKGEGAEGEGAEEVVVGAVMAGYDGHRGWLYYLATAPAHRGRGIGRDLVAEAERRLADLGCPKAMLMVRADNADVLDFYDRLGYAREATALAGKRLIPDL